MHFFQGDDDEGPSPAAPDCPHLLDERTKPDFREVFVSLAGRSHAMDTAVGRIRITGLDLTRREIASVESIRLLLGRVDALTLRAEAEAVLSDPVRARRLRHLVDRLRAGRIRIRSAPLAGWNPDFTVFRRSGRAWTVVVGLHWFARPFPHRGPALASVHGPSGAHRAARRFEQLWGRSHDIGPAVLNLLGRAEGRTSSGTDPNPTPEPLSHSTNRQGEGGRKPLPEKGKPGGDGIPNVLDTPTPSG